MEVVSAVSYVVQLFKTTEAGEQPAGFLRNATRRSPRVVTTDVADAAKFPRPRAFERAGRYNAMHVDDGMVARPVLFQSISQEN